MKPDLSRAVEESDADYAASQAIRATALKDILVSPLEYKWWHIDGNEKEETDALRFGRMFHAAILEPKLFLERHVVEPKFSGEGSRKAKADWRAKLPKDAMVIDAEDQVAIVQMHARLMTNRYAVELLEKGKAEHSLYWTDKETGLPCKCRPDFITTDGWILNLKTSIDIRLFKFRTIAFQKNYDLQAAMYCAGFEAVFGYPPEGYIFVACLKKAPFDNALYVADDTMMATGVRDYRKALSVYRECLDKGEWPGIQGVDWQRGCLKEPESENLNAPDWKLVYAE